MFIKLEDSQNYDISSGTSFAYVILLVKARDLLELIGFPTHITSLDDKTQLEWTFYNKNDKDKVLTIYDYREHCNLNYVNDWHIGGKGIKQEEIEKILKGIGLHTILNKTMDVGPIKQEYRVLI